MGQTNFKLFEVTRANPVEQHQNITFLHTTEPLEFLVRQMLRDAYNVGYNHGSASSSDAQLFSKKSFMDFFISYIDRDVKSSADNIEKANGQSTAGSDYYNTLMDVISNRENMQWHSGFREGRSCASYKDEPLCM